MPTNPAIDGSASPLFTPIALDGNATLCEADLAALSPLARERVADAPRGDCVCWGIPFHVDRVAVMAQEALQLAWSGVRAPWLVFMHTTDMVPQQRGADGLYADRRGPAFLGDRVANYVLLYADGAEARVPVRRQHQVGIITRGWGTGCFEAVAHRKPAPLRLITEDPRPGAEWGHSQFRVEYQDILPWTNYLWACPNPEPDKEIVGLRIEPGSGGLVISAITAGRTASMPLRWETRRKAILRLPEGTEFSPELSDVGLSKHLQIDLGQVISAQARTVYPNRTWARTYSMQPPEISRTEVLVEYAAHQEALVHLPGGETVPLAALEAGPAGPLTPVRPAAQRVHLRVLDVESGKPVAVKLHVHGEAGEYLQPLDRQRVPNVYWLEDYNPDYVNTPRHFCTYIPGETRIDLPLGNVYVEISKGFEIAPVRQVVRVTRATEELTFTLERVLPWRERGWVTADTHVHMLSPTTAHLEGAGEGVNVVNLLATQWGEMMTNVGDFDGRLTHGAIDTGGDGEYLVRVGTENRQHVLGHISLLGYNGPVISPMTVGGPDESALGDPVDILLTEWARQCRQQGGVVVWPHFPQPRGELAAAVLHGDIDAVEMTSWSSPYAGIDPYSLSDWYRFLNNGYLTAAVGGTDKMQSTTAVGTVRTYARIPDDRPFTYDTWKDAIRAANTFATYGPLLEFAVDGLPMGTRFGMSRSGGTVDVEWQVASVIMPMTKVELVVNGEIRESRTVDARADGGHWSVKVDGSAWLALLVRGKYRNRPEMIAAHSSPVMIDVAGKALFSAPDAETIVEQIEGALAFLDVLGTRAETREYRRMRAVLTSAHRAMHNRLHRAGVMHEHTVGRKHHGG